MSASGCRNAECTVAQTGLCLLNNEPDECSERLFEYATATGGGSHVTPPHDGAALVSPEDTPRFPPTTAMGMNDVRTIMAKEYCRLVGLLGAPDSGKTACLVSLYLLLSHNRLDGFTFADSRSLMALDELARGARRWQGGMPDQLTGHTELGDDRSAGFLHFKLRRQSDSARLNLFMPDLPGEWTNNLVDSNRTDRFSFLRSADVIWVMVNGETLIDRTHRQGTIHRTNLLVDRISALFVPSIPTVRLVVSRADSGRPEDTTLQQIQDHATRHGVDLSISHIASFSRTKEVQPGMGLSELMAQTVAIPDSHDDFWPGSKSDEQFGARNFLRISERAIP